MISYIDIAFILVAVVVTAVGASKGFLASLISAARLVLIVPASVYLSDFIKPYLTKRWFADQPMQILNIASFLICFIVLLIATGILTDLVINAQKKKGMPLKNTNAVLGGLLGFVKAAFIIFVVSGILGYLAKLIPQGSSFAEAVESSYALKYLKDVNLFEIIGGMK